MRAWLQLKIGLLGLWTTLVLCCSAEAQQVQWRRDYTKARAEAEQKGLPLLIDFGRDNCLWCDRLDQMTFSNSTVAATISRRFLPLKINATYDPELAQALKIDAFPTIVIAEPKDGKILLVQRGFVDASQFQGLMGQALTKLTVLRTAERLAANQKPKVEATPTSIRKETKPKPPPIVTREETPAWMIDDYESATVALVAQDAARAITLLKKIVRENKMLPIHGKATRLLQEIEQKGAEQLAAVRRIEENGDVSNAIAAAQEMARVYHGTRAAEQAAPYLRSLQAKLDAATDQRTDHAKSLLAQAQRDFDSKDYLTCLDRCETLTENYSDLPQSNEARDLLQKIKNDSTKLQHVCQTLPARYGTVYLAMAEMQMKSGNPQQAVYYLRRIIQAYPETPQAELAQVRLSQIEGPPSLTPKRDEG